MISMYRGSVEERYYLQPNRCRLHDFDGDIWIGSFDTRWMKNKTDWILMLWLRKGMLLSHSEGKQEETGPSLYIFILCSDPINPAPSTTYGVLLHAA